jgi:hypothetical protein
MMAITRTAITIAEPFSRFDAAARSLLMARAPSGRDIS